MSEEINDVMASQMIDRVSEHFEKQLRKLVDIDKEVQGLTKQANLILRSAEKLSKMRTDMVNNITSMQISYPELDGTSIDSREESAQPEVIELILNYNEMHKRYPKSLRDLPTASAVDNLPKTIDFEMMIQQAKQECRKRKRAASATSS